MTSLFTITAPADSGNVEVVDATDPTGIRLRIRPDGAASFHQWFHYRVTGAAGTALTMRIENAGEASYVPGWTDYRAVASEDGESWARVPTTYEDGVLTIRHTPTHGTARYAYFAPYGVTRHQALVERVAASPLATVLPLGVSLDGQPIEGVRVGTGERRVWVIGRQHPGESMGSWWMEGFLTALLADTEDARALRDGATVHVVPMMNPDGVLRGHLRTNAAGTDLNRAWAEPTQERSPEVHAVRALMEAEGCDLFFDAHGDEAIPNVFIAGAEGIPSWSDRLANLKRDFEAALLARTEDFQTEQGYPIPRPGGANPKIATNWVGERFDCLSMTLEMPFKDAMTNPDPRLGFSPDRCARLGEACLSAMAETLARLR